MRTLIFSLTALVFANAAGAATLTVVTDKPVYTIGETVTLTLIGNSEGEVASTYSLVGRLTYSAALTDPGSVGANALSPGPGWSETLPSQGDDGATAFTELFGFADFGFTGNAPNYNGDVVINTATLIASGTGIVNLDWTDSLSFFSISGAQPAAMFEVGDVPEPSTAALLSFGLLALARRRRHV